ncbi:hypothetical protein [Psychrobacillus sp. OK032]|uniref:hypothetical protein n=1 Tax=Psychrobacillus sp. OK032 TaxID=1884358 RepID=UPI0008BC8CF2|nr:hypothetical protein [Psychrobacillus sp. OK032]SES38522.1 hypothetical protein SAMN05518872_109189 [Psychrobacillus sp. OK032]
MHQNHTEKFTFIMEDSNGELIVKGEIEGESKVLSSDDLKFKGIIALLNSIDRQNFSESGNHPLFEHYIKEIEDTITEVKKHNKFQGKSDCREGLL